MHCVSNCKILQNLDKYSVASILKTKFNISCLSQTPRIQIHKRRNILFFKLPSRAKREVRIGFPWNVNSSSSQQSAFSLANVGEVKNFPGKIFGVVFVTNDSNSIGKLCISIVEYVLGCETDFRG
ncbi:unnamed protein product [Allacma fusca]|uniref:Uncharacterized protein n=1 Tax=Allacma fusca TaxID=39272 RepID=A0A8J2KPT9_9HEXA|nr:unnamed protein product [Allacma fusca]